MPGRKLCHLEPRLRGNGVSSSSPPPREVEGVRSGRHGITRAVGDGAVRDVLAGGGIAVGDAAPVLGEYRRRGAEKQQGKAGA